MPLAYSFLSAGEKNSYSPPLMESPQAGRRVGGKIVGSHKGGKRGPSHTRGFESAERDNMRHDGDMLVLFGYPVRE